MWQSWADTDSDKVMTLDTDMGSDKGMSEKLGHEFGLGQLSDTRVRPTLPCTPKFVVFFSKSFTWYINCYDGGFLLNEMVDTEMILVRFKNWIINNECRLFVSE